MLIIPTQLIFGICADPIDSWKTPTFKVIAISRFIRTSDLKYIVISHQFLPFIPRKSWQNLPLCGQPLRRSQRLHTNRSQQEHGEHTLEILPLHTKLLRIALVNYLNVVGELGIWSPSRKASQSRRTGHNLQCSLNPLIGHVELAIIKKWEIEIT